MLLIVIAGRALHRERTTGSSKSEVHAIDDCRLKQGLSKTYLEYVEEMEKAASATIAEMTAREIQAERARIEEKSGVKGYDYGNSWAKLV